MSQNTPNETRKKLIEESFAEFVISEICNGNANVELDLKQINNSYEISTKVEGDVGSLIASIVLGAMNNTSLREVIAESNRFLNALEKALNPSDNETKLTVDLMVKMMEFRERSKTDATNEEINN